VIPNRKPRYDVPMRIVAPVLLVLAACSTAPSARSPLREALAKAETPDVESAVRTCLVQNGWKVQDVGSFSGGASVVTAYKAKDQTDVYIYSADQKPRITGGPEDGSPFWKCLGGELAGGGADKDKADKDKADKDKGSDKE
jgi:hypothetical protein